ncbi:hypothetical protein RKE29_02945 [Streptomyces sp. B1866]|nr:hypothetical protein [Streptomyces sp. B1866]MDT3395617.1 hypothetical protein [Streptomyces sp. B1866]
MEVAAGRVDQRRGEVPQVPEVDRWQTRRLDEGVELLRDGVRMQPCTVFLGEDFSGVRPRQAVLQPLVPFGDLPRPVLPQYRDRQRVQSDGARRTLRLGLRLHRRPAVDHDLLGHRQVLAVEVGFVPILSDTLAPSQSAEGDEVEEGVQAVSLGLVEEHAELRGGPHHDGTRLPSRLPPALDMLVRPQNGLRAALGIQFDVLGRVEGDEPLRDGRVQRGP